MVPLIYELLALLEIVQLHRTGSEGRGSPLKNCTYTQQLALGTESQTDALPDEAFWPADIKVSAENFHVTSPTDGDLMYVNDVFTGTRT